MGELRSFRRGLKVLLVFSLVTIIIGSVVLYQKMQSRSPRIETQPHPLPPVSQASTLPGDESVFVSVDDLRIKLELHVSTYHFHNGDKGTWLSLDGIIKNNGTTSVDDLCFWRITVYWADGAANFTTGFTRSDNYTIEPGEIVSVSLDDSNDWTGIPDNLCWNFGGQGYGRVLISYQSNRTSILTTDMVQILNAVE